MIKTKLLTKDYGKKRAVDNLTIQVRPGEVTGFLGPNGAGKTTTMKMIMGLQTPSSGEATINGRPLCRHRAPMREVGASLNPRDFHPGRTARAHLSSLAATHGIGTRRVDEVLGLTGLEAVANKRAGTFSLGMSQRLGIAAALLGDPATLILDEPVNGLDPEGVVWVRDLVKRLAAEGRTIFLSSHLMNEMAVTADHLIVIGRGKLLAEGSMESILKADSEVTTTVRSPQIVQLRDVLVPQGASVELTGSNEAIVKKIETTVIGETAAKKGLVLHELTPVRTSLEQVFMNLTGDAVEYRSTSAHEPRKGQK
jgi:ABC transporter related